MTKRRTAAQRQELLQNFFSSGLSAKQWCAQQGISYQTLLLWKKKLDHQAKSSFIELENESVIELRWKGLTVSFSHKEDLKGLHRLLSVLC